MQLFVWVCSLNNCPPCVPLKGSFSEWKKLTSRFFTVLNLSRQKFWKVGYSRPSRSVIPTHKKINASLRAALNRTLRHGSHPMPRGSHVGMEFCNGRGSSRHLTQGTWQLWATTSSSSGVQTPTERTRAPVPASPPRPRR